jgi:hypothetical protein
MTAEPTDVLRAGIARTLEIWRERLGGARDPLCGVLAQQLADSLGGPRPELTPEVRRAYDAVRGYYDNVRYALLDPVAMIWGTVANALRVAAGIESVTPAQRAVFAFEPESLARFFRAGHVDVAIAEQLWRAFRPMPAADCQTLAALFNPHMDARIEPHTLLAVVRVLGNEGPLTSEEARASTILQSAGLISPAFAGIRGRT